MTFTPNSKVRLCSVPFSDYTNVLSFGKDDTARANYFASKVVYDLTSTDGYSYVKGSGAIRINKNKESLYNINYMMYRNDNFGNKWFYAFVDSIEYINANVTELRFSIDVWQTWESALNFHESFIVRQHIPKSEDTIGANLQPEGFTNLRYVEEKRKRKDLCKDSPDLMRIIVLASSWYDETSKTFKETNNTNTIDGNVQGLFLIPFESVTYMRNYINHYLQDNANRSKEIIAIYQIPADFAVNTGFTNGKPLGMPPNNSTEANEWISDKVQFSLAKLTNIDIGTHGTQNIVTANNNKMFTFPFTKIVLTNNNGSSLTFRQEFFDGTKTSGNNIVFNVLNSPCLPVTAVCYPDNYREGDETNALTLQGFPQCSWVSDTYQQWLALNQNTLNYQQWTPIINGLVNQGTGLINSAFGGSGSYIGTGGQVYLQENPKSQAGGLFGAISQRVGQIGEQFTSSINNLVSTGEQIWSFYAKKADMELQPNNSNGVINSSQIMNAISKLCFTVTFQRLSYEQFKQIDNYFDKFGYAINDFKPVNYHNRSNFDYIETSQVVIDGDVPEDDMNAIKNIFNSGVRIWHNTKNFLNYDVANN